MSAQGDCEFLVKRARELVGEDPWAAKAWLITARTLYPADFNIQYEMYTIERNAERTASAGRLLYDMFVNFPDQPAVWREIGVITAALRNDNQDKQTQFLRGLFETLPGRIQCEMLLKATEQCFNTLERAEMLLLLLRRFPETVVQHGINLGETLLEAENLDDQESPVNCFRKLFVCDVLPLIINNPDVRLPSNLLYKYLHKAAEFYVAYITRPPVTENLHQGTQDAPDLKSPSKRSAQKYIIEGLSEKSSQIVDPWDRLFEILSVVGMRCEWQVDKGTRSFADILHRMKELCRYISSFDSEAHVKYKNQVVYSALLVFFKNAFQYVSSIQPSLFHSSYTPNQASLILLEDLSSAYGDADIDRSKHIHKKRKLAEAREKTMSSDDEECSGKGRGRHILVNKGDLPNSIEILESFKLARESWELLHSQDSLDKEFSRLCLSWKTDSWLWLRIFLTDMIIYQGQYKKALTSLHHQAALQGSQQQVLGPGSLEQQRALIQMASCHFALGEYRPTCEKVLEVMCYVIPPTHEGGRVQDDPLRVKSKFRKGSDLKLLPFTNKTVMPYCLQLLLACFKLRAFTDKSDDLALGHVIVLLQHDWPKGENLFLKAVDKICQQGNFQYENFFNYVTNIDMLEEFAYLRTQEGGKVHLELLPNQGILIKTSSPPLGLLQQEFIPVLHPSIQTADRHHTVTRGITKGVKEDFRLAMERQVSRCGENLMMVLHRFCINEKIILLQTLA
ncbi:integrator complex subunit 10 isoform X1 [Latimeria chalumnae]|uniref:Integrator complex subunit 10 n=1 Tax=Latimeria chalumnae TaxID=7897 RepID=H3ADL7_LATCH|nr:PREDICTED: integrator complex subunit 10 isoform X2 [Latimeria chalumnae]|eukprot:XP_014342362.1 PREDICTED: integrator complex subunit 10 isoform X2 [Latimeria chalumnae]